MPALIMSAILAILIIWFIVGFTQFETNEVNRQAKELKKRTLKYQAEWEAIDPVFRKRIEEHMRKGY